MLVSVPVSLGELVDKITILKIKLLFITDADKLANVRKEYDHLRTILEETNTLTENDELFLQLYDLNLKFWTYHDWQRERWALAFQSQTIDEELYWRTREEHLLNDDRARLKKEINRLFQSDIVEEKQFRGYAI